MAHGSMLLGEGSIEPAVDRSPPGWAQAFAFRSVRAGTVSAVEVYVGRHSRAKRIASGLYSDSSCHPGSMITRGTMTRPKDGAWNAVHVRAVAVQANKTYWLFVLGSGGMLSLRDQSARRCSTRVAQQRYMTMTTLAHAWNGRDKKGASRGRFRSARIAACRLSAYAKPRTQAPRTGHCRAAPPR